ncbi:putative baseplate assembly protein [Paenibacillus psychroresistens]|uniref:Putative baseplate assembly protein n=1 Tax=Paenibacillus psychroresistens TaxID=1778678 RepID=A0A6B8RK45_9BACL|nr:baseplate J/gp47 family protein [Paenibacillus psychroresistens]QGQ96640.1 putative baseplate assembly protein [Paenibacillus psychroresistens]
MMKAKNGGEFMLPPMIDTRDMQALIQKMSEMVPYYTPEWRFTPEDPDPGTALFSIFSEMFMENIKRLNRTPVKNFIAFLNLLDVSILTAKPASSYVTFNLSLGAQEAVYLPAGTQVTGKSTDGKDDLIFETEKSMLVTPAVLSSIYKVSTKQDKIIQISDSFNEDRKDDSLFPIALYNYEQGENLQQHSWYLGHDYLFNIKQSARIEITITHSLQKFMEQTLCGKLANNQNIEWSFSGLEGWIPFDEVKVESNRLILIKNNQHEIVELELEGKTNRWLQGKVKPRMLEEITLKNGDIVIDGIQVKADYYDHLQQGGIAPDLIFSNDLQLENVGMFPFGEQFLPNSTFFISSQEVFSKKAAQIHLQFSLKNVLNRIYPEITQEVDWKLIMKESKLKQPEVTYISVLKVVWEYWNGNGWVLLFSNKQYDEIFYKPGEEIKFHSLKFKCPSDLEQTFVNAQYNYWIRARILTIEDMYSANSIYLTPWVENISLQYEYGAAQHEFMNIFATNNLESKSWLSSEQTSKKSFKPFFSLESKFPGFYMGFASKPAKGPISIFFSLVPQAYTEDQVPLIEWEYLSLRGTKLEWAPLKVADKTDQFIRSGTIKFAGPLDFANASLFGKTQYWIRAVNRDGKFDRNNELQPIPAVKGIYLNTTLVIQQESIENELPDPIGEAGKEEYVLSRYPVVSEAVWVDETSHFGEEDILAFQDDPVHSLEIIRDSEGHIQKSWVKWLRVENFYESESNDRHYITHRSSGKIRFGDGKHGKVPPNPGRDKIKVNYKIGGGKKGNIAAHQIQSLQNSIAFIQSIDNPEPSGGGCDMETLGEALRRGPQLIKHRNRAVTAEDFEWLARQADSNIAKVKCLSNVNANAVKEAGCVTVVVLPKGGSAGLAFSNLKRRVEQYLLERAANSIAFPEKIQVIEPAYIEISIYADLVVNSIEDIIPTEMDTNAKLTDFLDPFRGNYDGKGWDIGQRIHSSTFYALLKSISNVNHVAQLSMTLNKIEQEKRTEISMEAFDHIQHGILVNGIHKITVNVL